MNPGVAYALGAYTLWGLFPLYFKLLHQVPALQILAHRMVWSLLLVFLILLVLKRWAWMRLLREQPAVLARFTGSALLLACNWGTYIWAVNHDHVVEASLGYYINPLLNVALGTFILHERLRPAQWLAIGIAALGVGWMTTEVGHVPWIALVLAFSFAGYSLLRKTAPLGSLEGLAVETAVLFPLALAYLAWEGAQGANVFASSDWSLRWLLIAAGPVPPFRCCCSLPARGAFRSRCWASCNTSRPPSCLRWGSGCTTSLSARTGPSASGWCGPASPCMWWRACWPCGQGATPPEPEPVRLSGGRAGK